MTNDWKTDGANSLREPVGDAEMSSNSITDFLWHQVE